MSNRYHTPASLAKLYGVNQSKILAWIHAGQLEALDVSAEPGRGRPRWRISPEAVRRFEQRRSSFTKAATQATPRRRRSAAAVPQYV
ncbi:MAG: helix-turn-helix domain-containing protein [Phycisphaeraceae bacterium]